MFGYDHMRFQREQSERVRKLHNLQMAAELFGHANSQMEAHAMRLYRSGRFESYEHAKRSAIQTMGPKTAEILQQQLRAMGAGSDVTVACP